MTERDTGGQTGGLSWLRQVATSPPSAVIGWTVTAVCLVGWILRVRPLGTVWGDVGTWVAAMGTLLAVGWAVRVTYLERGDRKAAEARLTAAQDQAKLDEMRHQASQIAFWTILSADKASREYVGVAAYDADALSADDPDRETNTGWIHPDPEGRMPVLLHLQNRGDSPVYNCVVASGVTELRLKFVGVLPPGTDTYPESIADPTGGSSSSFRWVVEVGRGGPVRWIEFRDLNHVVWRRYPDGTLREMKQPPIDPRHFHYG